MSKEQAIKKTGSCLCKAVNYTAEFANNHVHVCHCTLCRIWSGGPGLSAQCNQDIEITGEDNLTWYGSSEWAKRGFCNKCGTNLFFKVNPDAGDYYGVSAGTIDDQSALKITGHIFIDFKPPYYDFNDDSPRQTEEEFLAQFSSK